MIPTSVVAWLWTYLAPVLGGYLVLGVILEVCDRYVGVGFYRWYYNRGVKPEQRMPAHEEIGFFYRRPFRMRHKRAIAVSMVLSGLALMFGNYSGWEKLAEIPALFVEAWFLLPGLWLGDKLFGLHQRQEQIFDAIEHKEETAKKILTGLGGMLGQAKDAVAAAIPTPHAEPEKPKEPPKPMSAKDILQRHADGRNL